MKRIIVDYSKLTAEILSLLVEKYPIGYNDRDIISFRNSKNEFIEAVEVRTEDTIYLVKISTKLEESMVKFDIESYGKDSGIDEIDEDPNENSENNVDN